MVIMGDYYEMIGSLRKDIKRNFKPVYDLTPLKSSPSSSVGT